VLRAINRFQREIDATKDLIENIKTLSKERPALIEKLRHLLIGKEIAE
jgi:hypothetical protein